MLRKFKWKLKRSRGVRGGNQSLLDDSVFKRVVGQDNDSTANREGTN
jgi:hypothetical protein